MPGLRRAPQPSPVADPRRSAFAATPRSRGARCASRQVSPELFEFAAAKEDFIPPRTTYADFFVFLLLCLLFLHSAVGELVVGRVAQKEAATETCK
ncbi:hypothetical protein MTO96_005393 [Rhipicephalus appendiculatus]